MKTIEIDDEIYEKLEIFRKFSAAENQKEISFNDIIKWIIETILLCNEEFPEPYAGTLPKRAEKE